MHRLLAIICVTIAVVFSIYHLTTLKQTDVNYRFEIIEGKRIATDNKNVYVLEIIDKGPKALCIRTSSGWNLTLNESLWVSNVLKCFNGNIYAAGVDVLKIRDGRIEWVKALVRKRVSYEGTRENPIPVYYEDVLNVFDMESDGKYLYLNTRDGIVKTDADLNVIWAVELRNLNDEIAASDGIYVTKLNSVIKLDRDGEIEWAVSLKSNEKIKLEIPEEKRKAAEKEGKILPEFYRVDKYSIEIYTVYADDYVYVAGLACERLSDHEEIYPFLAKLNTDGSVVWAEIVNITYPGCDEDGCIFYPSSSKILKLDRGIFIAWISEKILLVFDENGKILDCYELKGYISDVDLIDNTILLASPEKANVEKRNTLPIQIDIKAVKIPLEGKRIECYSKNWETPIYIS